MTKMQWMMIIMWCYIGGGVGSRHWICYCEVALRDSNPLLYDHY